MVALSFAAGLIGLVAGAELLVRGASRAATSLHVPPLVIGLTVVAYGTSAPELAVSLSATLAGSSDLAVANVVGSNVFNVLAILGVCALLAPLSVGSRVLRREIPVMVVVSLAFLAVAADGALGRVEGAVLLTGMMTMTVWTLRGTEARSEPSQRTPRRPPVTVARDAVLVVVGLALLVLGGRLLVAAASAAAADLGVSELVIGLTIVAAGTSLPELATSVVALVRGQRDLAIGNVVGSNVFNLLGILGVSAVAAPRGLLVAEQVLVLDVWVMLGAALVLLPLAWSGGVVARWEGAVLLLGYFFYSSTIVAQTLGALVLPGSSTVAVCVMVAVLVVTLPVVVRAARR